MPISDYRFDPYNNVIVPFQINSETHVIPSNAPYVIRLNEVPLKESPSSLTVKFENNTALTEVSASPAAGQFWPDFNTADQNWNTGTLKFNVADAGKVVKVSYKGTGTLAGVKSNRYPSWWLERGDGSLGDKVCTNGEVFEGVYNFKSFTVPIGVTVSINRTAIILCTGAFINKGAVIGYGRGAFGGPVGSDGGVGEFAGSGGGGLSTSSLTFYYGGSASAATIDYVVRNNTAWMFGGGGSGGNNGLGGGNSPSGGPGGAGIIVRANQASVGTISMDGAGGISATGMKATGASGGGGGAVLVIANIISNPSITVAGGGGGAPGSSGSWGTAGAAGWFKLIELGVL